MTRLEPATRAVCWLVLLWVCLLLFVASVARADVAYLVAPKTGGFFITQSLSERDGPHQYVKGAKLVIAPDKWAQASERVLVDVGANNAGVLDHNPTFDGKFLLTSIVTDGQSDLYRVNVATATRERLTNTPTVWEIQPCELADGTISYLSDQDNWKNPHEVYKAFTRYVMNADGSNPHRVWHAGLGGLFGLNNSPDGRTIWSTGENQGDRHGGGNNWSIWSDNIDGSEWGPEFSAFHPRPSEGAPADWPCITSDRSLVVSMYYDTRIYGPLLRCPVMTAGPQSPPTHFGSGVHSDNPKFPLGFYDGAPVVWSFGFQRRGLTNLTKEMNFFDIDSKGSDGKTFVGRFSHPSPLPGNGILCTHTGFQTDADMDCGVRMIRDVTKPAEKNSDTEVYVDTKGRHEWFPRYVGPYRNIYGIDKPPIRKNIPTKRLPPGSPFGYIGSSSVDRGEFVINEGPEPGQTFLRPTFDDEPEYLRIIAFNPTTTILNPGGLALAKYNNQYPWFGGIGNSEGFVTPVNERVGFYDPPIPLKKYRTPDGKLHLGPNPPAGSIRILRKDNRPDTSWLVQVPANQPWSFQLLDKDHKLIINAETWHQSLPREWRTDCHGCHNHEQPDSYSMADTFAAGSEYPRYRLEQVRRIVYERDVKPKVPEIHQQPWTVDRSTVYAWHTGRDSEWFKRYTGNKVLTPEIEMLLRDWHNLGFLAAGSTVNNQGQLVPLPLDSKWGPYADTMEPTVSPEVLADRIAVGLFDPDSGLDESTIAFTLDDKNVTGEFKKDAAEFIWTRMGNVPQGKLVINVKDKHGNGDPVTVDIKDNAQARVPVGTYLGKDADKTGPRRVRTPDGKNDWHLHVENLHPTKAPTEFEVRTGHSPAIPGFDKWDTFAGGESAQWPDGTFWRLHSELVGTTLDLWIADPGFTDARTQFTVFVHYGPGERDTVEIPVAPTPPPTDELAKVKEQLAAAQAEITRLLTENSTFKALVDAYKAWLAGAPK